MEKGVNGVEVPTSGISTWMDSDGLIDGTQIRSDGGASMQARWYKFRLRVVLYTLEERDQRSPSFFGFLCLHD